MKIKRQERSDGRDMQQGFKTFFAEFKSSERCRSGCLGHIETNLELTQHGKVDSQIRDPKADFHEQVNDPSASTQRGEFVCSLLEQLGRAV
jgi:hypothetical protein